MKKSLVVVLLLSACAFAQDLTDIILSPNPGAHRVREWAGIINSNDAALKAEIVDLKTNGVDSAQVASNTVAIADSLKDGYSTGGDVDLDIGGELDLGNGNLRADHIHAAGNVYISGTPDDPTSALPQSEIDARIAAASPTNYSTVAGLATNALQPDATNAIIAEAVAQAGSGNLSSNDVGGMAFEDPADYAGVITNEYTVTTPLSLTRIFDPNTPRVRYHGLAPYELTGSATVEQVSSEFTSGACRIPRIIADGDRVYYNGIDLYGINEAKYVLHGYMIKAGADSTIGARVKLYPGIVTTTGSSLDTTGGYYDICATNGFFSITNTVSAANNVNAVAQFVVVELDPPNGGGITNLIGSGVYILGVNAVIPPSYEAQTVGTYLLDGGAVEQ